MSNDETEETEKEGAGDGLRMHCWKDGTSHIVPEDFTITPCTTLVGWQLWCIGRIGPFVDAIFLALESIRSVGRHIERL